MATGSFNFGTASPSFTLQEILLYRLQVTVSSWSCTYASGSGSYTSYTSISAFISDLQAGTLPAPDGTLPSFGTGDAPPDILVRMPCFVVVVLTGSDQASLGFQPTAMTTGANCSSKYYCLTELPSFGGGSSTVVYFAVPAVAPASQHVADPYTLFLQYTSGGTTIPHAIDPCLKNRGNG